MIKNIIGWGLLTQVVPLLFAGISTLAIRNGNDHLTNINSTFFEGYVIGWVVNVIATIVSIIVIKIAKL